MSVSVICELDFCAAHRLVDYDGKCAHPHGHNYRVQIECEGHIDDHGFVVDFGVVKDRYKAWIDLHWDHGFVYWDRDPVIFPLYAKGGPLEGFKCYAMTANPTAENMADLLRLMWPRLLPDLPGVVCRSVQVWETDRASAVSTL